MEYTNEETSIFKTAQNKLFEFALLSMIFVLPATMVLTVALSVHKSPTVHRVVIVKKHLTRS